MQFIIIHGSFGNPQEAWFPKLKSDLKELGHKVFAPTMPVDDWDEMTKVGPSYKMQNQNLPNWLKAFETQVLTQIDQTKPISLVAHSLAPVFSLHAIEKWNLQLDTAIFIAPFLTKLNQSWQIDVANDSFYKDDFNFLTLKNLIPVSYVLYANNDPYVDTNHSLHFAQKLNSQLIEVKNAGHMGSASGITDFKLVLELCKTRTISSEE